MGEVLPILKAACTYFSDNGTVRLMSKFTLAAILALAAANAAAASNPETLFSCTLQNGKRVDIRYQAAKGARAATVLYRYGANLAHPEIAFTQPADQVYYTQMQGAVERSDDEGGTFMQGGMPVHILHLSPSATQKHDISAVLQTGGDAEADTSFNRKGESYALNADGQTLACQPNARATMNVARARAVLPQDDPANRN